MKKPFSAWKEGAPHYVPPLILGVCLIAAFWESPAVWLGVLVLALGLFALSFFRDFPRTANAGPNDLVSPADGTIVGMEDIEATPHYDGPCKRVSIFLSVFNAHVNRSPFDGDVTAIEYKQGQFKNAMRADTSELNEANTVRMRTDFGPVSVRQISGAIARRIVCRTEVGERLARGEKFGMIKFGSRTELYLPKSTEICVTLNQKVYAGKTIIARFP